MLKRYFSEPLDRAALTVIGILSTTIVGLLVSNATCRNVDQCWLSNRPQVENFSWADQELGSQDQAFILTFDRQVDRQAVEENLAIAPALPGKISWVGRKMAYTLERPIPYGTTFELQLSDVREQFTNGSQEAQLVPFNATFQSRDRAFAYIGTQGVEQGRIVYYNLSKQRKTILTPPGLTVVDFQFYDQGKQILLAGTDSQLGFEGLQQLQLYRQEVVETDNPQLVPKPQLVLDNEEFQNNQFDVSSDGETIVVQRVNRRNPADFDLWMLAGNQAPKRLKVQGGEFQIAPDDQSLAVARGEGIGILPLEPESKPLDFLPKFGQLLSFAPDGSAAALVNFNVEDAQKRFQRTLVFVNNQGMQQELLDTEGSIVSCEFSDANRWLYCLLTQLLPGDNYLEEPYFVQIDLKSGEVFPLVKLNNYRDTQVSLSPDGLALLLDQVQTDPNAAAQNPLNNDAGEAITSSQLWLLIPPLQPENGDKAELKPLSINGFHPQWAP